MIVFFLLGVAWTFSGFGASGQSALCVFDETLDAYFYSYYSEDFHVLSSKLHEGFCLQKKECWNEDNGATILSFYMGYENALTTTPGKTLGIVLDADRCVVLFERLLDKEIPNKYVHYSRYSSEVESIIVRFEKRGRASEYSVVTLALPPAIGGVHWYVQLYWLYNYCSAPYFSVTSWHQENSGITRLQAGAYCSQDENPRGIAYTGDFEKYWGKLSSGEQPCCKQFVWQEEKKSLTFSFLKYHKWSIDAMLDKPIISVCSNFSNAEKCVWMMASSRGISLRKNFVGAPDVFYEDAGECERYIVYDFKYTNNEGRVLSIQLPNENDMQHRIDVTWDAQCMQVLFEHITNLNGTERRSFIDVLEVSNHPGLPFSVETGGVKHDETLQALRKTRGWNAAVSLYTWDALDRLGLEVVFSVINDGQCVRTPVCCMPIVEVIASAKDHAGSVVSLPSKKLWLNMTDNRCEIRDAYDSKRESVGSRHQYDRTGNRFDDLEYGFYTLNEQNHAFVMGLPSANKRGDEYVVISWSAQAPTMLRFHYVEAEEGKNVLGVPQKLCEPLCVFPLIYRGFDKRLTMCDMRNAPARCSFLTNSIKGHDRALMLDLPCEFWRENCLDSLSVSVKFVRPKKNGAIKDMEGMKPRYVRFCVQGDFLCIYDQDNVQRFSYKFDKAFPWIRYELEQKDLKVKEQKAWENILLITLPNFLNGEEGPFVRIIWNDNVTALKGDFDCKKVRSM